MIILVSILETMMDVLRCSNIVMMLQMLHVFNQKMMDFVNIMVQYV